MSERNTVARSMHDLGLAAWFGGSLMGAVGLNGATSEADDPRERLRLAALGWKRWSPVNAAAIGVHALGGLGLIAGNRRRVGHQDGALANTIIKSGLTVAAAALTAYSGALGRKVEQEGHQGGKGATEPDPSATRGLATAQTQLRQIQWAIPAVTALLVVLGAQQGEQQRPSQQARGRIPFV